MTLPAGTWQDPFILGGPLGLYWWFDFTNNCGRKKAGSAPTSETDGVPCSYGRTL